MEAAKPLSNWLERGPPVVGVGVLTNDRRVSGPSGVTTYNSPARGWRGRRRLDEAPDFAVVGTMRQSSCRLQHRAGAVGSGHRGRRCSSTGCGERRIRDGNRR